ncbi:hypothetical protein M569_12205 [Genlisea aurea]|uniref:Uncharacterized protein n=1 Tax=Genlisea aurea TaxID=192259 RepID=S8DIG1_9LAMI|nr:hypothetical protein M569_12205 [Genlisea aurea]
MRKIACHLLSKKPVSLPRAAKLMTRFTAVDNGASPVVSNYLQRVADALDLLVQFHSKSSNDGENSNRETREEFPAKETKDSCDKKTGKTKRKISNEDDDSKDRKKKRKS